MATITSVILMCNYFYYYISIYLGFFVHYLVQADSERLHKYVHIIKLQFDNYLFIHFLFYVFKDRQIITQTAWNAAYTRIIQAKKR